MFDINTHHVSKYVMHLHTTDRVYIIHLSNCVIVSDKVYSLQNHIIVLKDIILFKNSRIPVKALPFPPQIPYTLTRPQTLVLMYECFFLVINC